MMQLLMKKIILLTLDMHFKIQEALQRGRGDNTSMAIVSAMVYYTPAFKDIDGTTTEMRCAIRRRICRPLSLSLSSKTRA